MQPSSHLHNQEGTTGSAATTISMRHCFHSLLRRCASVADTTTAGTLPLCHLLHRCRRYNNQCVTLLPLPPSTCCARCRCTTSFTVVAATTISARRCFRSLLQCAPSRQRQLINSSEGGTSLPIQQLSFASAEVAGQNAQITNAITTGLK